MRPGTRPPALSVRGIAFLAPVRAWRLLDAFAHPTARKRQVLGVCGYSGLLATVTVEVLRVCRSRCWAVVQPCVVRTAAWDSGRFASDSDSC